MDTPYIKLIEHSQEASQQAIIFIRGYISENLDVKIEKNWINSVRESGFKGAIYYLWWDSGKSTLGNYPLECFRDGHPFLASRGYDIRDVDPVWLQSKFRCT